MSQSTSAWLVLVLALVLANLPFVNHRLLVVIKLRQPDKNLATRLAELVFWYFATGGIALALEQRLGQIAPQGWEFYAITGTLFVTLAFPGFIYRYLLKLKH